MGNLIKKNDFFSPSIFKDFFEDDIFNDRFFHRRGMPPVNVSEDNEKYQIELSVPGIEKENINITRDKDMLTVSYEQKTSDEYRDKNYHKREFQCSSFTRSFNLPPDVDFSKIDSMHHDGVLTIHLPKLENAKREDMVNIEIH
ncbi:Hsp20/alpha crystallin family protein [Ilyobacter polytropus]|uniref:Heat shock protein Hsp20 n=1 Tax=Ilyobacter polytropus (strain ATCC 51220 / DSM 2926 / LMG 16218 / CuHBu1) TaxID=572544 RepID=E3HCD5_ILYPC|nr:Hsp20/alpha crystallin family protein [Ilyobacter polytropus]ADO84395.1 heat shock protein Hsp20 [Ilyobacter polytropus DSM 2926]